MAGAVEERWLRVWAFAAVIAVAALACERASREAGADARGTRIVTVGGAVTETVFALGLGDRVVARDTTSVYPPAATALPDVGYLRQLAAEGILAHAPDIVLVPADAGPASTLEQLRGAGVNVVVMPAGHDPAATVARIEAIGAAIGKDDEARALAARVRTDVEAAVGRAAASARTSKVAFLYSRGGGNHMISGAGTAAASMIELAGATNAVVGYDGYKPLSAEAIVAAAPDAILVPAGSLPGLGGVAGVVALPGIADTPAGRARRVVAVDDLLLLGFGPRLAEGIDTLAQALR